MRRLLLLVLLVGLAVSVGCKDDKTIAPKNVPPPPKGPPTGASKDAGGANQNKSPELKP